MEADVGPPLNQHWSQLILASEPETIYKISRTEPFRLLGCVCQKTSPITPALIGRTVKTVISILEPEQPDLIHALHQSLRTAAHTKQPVALQYRIGVDGPMKHATVMDEGPQKDYLTIMAFAFEEIDGRRQVGFGFANLA